MKTIIFSMMLLLCQHTVKAGNEKKDYFLWQVNINGTEFILAGSIHAGKPEHYPRPDTYINAYNQADKIIFEIKEGPKELEKLKFSYAGKDSLEEGQYLDKHLCPESKETLSLLFKGKEDQLVRYYHYEPWLLNMIVSGRKYIFLGYDQQLSVDMYFHGLAAKDGKKIIGLEKAETQFALFDFNIPYETQLKVLEAGLKNVRQQALNDQALFENYYNSDMEGFKEAFLTSMNLENSQRKSVYDKIFATRNKEWVRKLIELSSNNPGTYFMLVGSGHYFGPENILELLEKDGFTVKPYVAR
jgi:uncharacterized protein